MQTNVIILAAGEGKRMMSDTPKGLHPLLGRPMAGWVIQAVQAIDSKPVMVVGHQGDLLQKSLGTDIRYVWQKEQLGTGHASRMALPLLADDTLVLITAVDMPLVRAESYALLVEAVDQGAQAALLTAVVPRPGQMGRILRDATGAVTGIVEYKDATDTQRQIAEVNSGVYCFRAADLHRLLPALGNNNQQGEFYLTDMVALLVQEEHQVTACVVDHQEILGCNQRVELSLAGAALRERINEQHMLQGVTIIDPMSTWIDPQVVIGRDTVIYPNNHLQGNTVVGCNVELLPGNRIQNSRLGDGVRCESSVVLSAVVGKNTTIGPFAYLRPDAVIGENARIGDFVEIKNATVGDHSKVSHLSYLGDGEIGEHTNIGCGVVFSNYDGHDKSRTVVGDRAFIGCNTNLVAPVTVQDDAYVAAGSTITDDVPQGALSIARARQVNKEGWVEKRRRRWQNTP